MTLRTLRLDLGTLDPPQYATGWYRDPNTGQYYYYEAAANQWYILAAGILQPLEVPKLSAPKVVSIAPGDTLRIEYSYKYTGPAITVTEYASIGKTTLGVYDEKVVSKRTRSLPASTTAVVYTGSLDLILPAGAPTDWDDIECKVFDGGKELGVNYQGALNIVAAVPIFTDFAITDYKKL